MLAFCTEYMLYLSVSPLFRSDFHFWSFIYIFSLSGFGTAVSFVSLNNDDDIETVYDFVRNKLPKRLDESDVNKEDFYGKFYSSAPADFEFQPGDLNWYRMTENTEEIINVLKTNQNYRKVLNHFQMYTERET